MPMLQIPHEPTPVVHHYAYFLDGTAPGPERIEATVARAWERIEGLPGLARPLGRLRAEMGADLRDEHLRCVACPPSSVVRDPFFALNLDPAVRAAAETAPCLQISAPNRAADDPFGLLVGQFAAEAWAQDETVLVHDWAAARALNRGAVHASEMVRWLTLGESSEVFTRGMSKFGLPELILRDDDGRAEAILAVVVENLVSQRRFYADQDPNFEVLPLPSVLRLHQPIESGLRRRLRWVPNAPELEVTYDEQRAALLLSASTRAD